MVLAAEAVGIASTINRLCFRLADSNMCSLVAGVCSKLITRRKGRRPIPRQSKAAGSGALFDHLVSDGEQRWRHFEAERLGGKLYVRRDAHMRAPDGGEMYDTTIELPVTIKDPDKPIGTHIFTVVARTDAALRWTEVTIDDGDDAKDALDRITLPLGILDRIAPSATPRSSIIISDEPMSSETNYRTEFVVVLNDQPQGGFANRARSPGMRFARRDGFGFNRLGDWFFGDSRPPRGQSYGRRQGWGW
jgi:ribosomal protein L14